MKISVVIPAYFEKENVGELTKRLLLEIEKIDKNFQILYVIQGDDGSKEILSDFKDSRVRFLYFDKPLGVAKAFLVGFKEVVDNSEYIITMDSDLNHQPEEIHRLWDTKMKTKANVVIGSRFIKGGKIIGMPLWKNIASRTMNKIINVFSGISVADKTSGYRIYDQKVVECVLDNMNAQNFEFYPEVILIANKFGFTFAEAPITFIFRTRGESKMYKFQTIVGYIKMFMKKFK